MDKYRIQVIVIAMIGITALIFLGKQKIYHINQNKGITVGVITAVKESSINYTYVVDGVIYKEVLPGSTLRKDITPSKKVVVYNSLDPQQSFIFLDKPLHDTFELGDDITNRFKDTLLEIPLGGIGL
jgi:hypothetical protein